MPMRMKVNGTWTGPIASGNFRVKRAGAWTYPAYCRMRVNGAWVDTGYVGYPAVPANLWVHAWSYSAIALNWTLGTGGAPVSAVNLVQTDVNGNWLNQVEVAPGGPWGNFGMNWDTRYRFYIRAKGASGLYSAFYGPLNVGCGHPRQDTYGYVTRYRGWQSDVPSGARNKDDPFWVNVPSSVTMDGMHWRNLRTPMSSVVTPYGNRTVNWILNGGDFGAISANLGTVYSGNNTDYGFGNQGSDTPWGIVARGAGWSTTGNGTYMLWCDGLWVTGTEAYANYEIVSTIYEQGNYYW